MAIPGESGFASSLTRGIVSGLDRAVERYSEEGMTYIQTDAASIRQLRRAAGELVRQVVGINSSKIITERYEGMGFAHPGEQGKGHHRPAALRRYVEGRVRLGITGSDVTAAQSAFYGIPRALSSPPLTRTAPSRDPGPAQRYHHRH